MKRLALGAALLAFALPGAASAQYTGYKAPKPTYGSSYSPPKPPQAPYQNYGATSPTTNKPMTNTVSGYVRKDGTYVNPYARSK